MKEGKAKLKPFIFQIFLLEVKCAWVGCGDKVAQAGKVAHWKRPKFYLKKRQATFSLSSLIPLHR